MTLYQDTIATIDGMPAIKDARLAIVRAQTALRSADFTVDDATRPAAALVASLVAGDPIPDDLGAQVLDVRRQREESAARHRALNIAAEQLKDHERGVIYAGAEALIVGLRPRFTAIIDGAKEATADLGGARTADAAIAAGMKNAGAWARLVAVTAQYDEMRSTHFKLLMDNASDVGDMEIGSRVLPLRDVVDDVGLWRNAEQVWPERWDGRPQSRMQGVPWPAELRPQSPGVLTQVTVDVRVPRPTPQFMAWLVTSSAEPWLPTLVELSRARVELGRLHNEREKEWAAAQAKGPAALDALQRERKQNAEGHELLRNRGNLDYELARHYGGER